MRHHLLNPLGTIAAILIVASGAPCEAQSKSPNAQVVSIHLTAKGTFTVDGNEVAADKLSQAISSRTAEVKDDGKSMGVLITADKDAKYESLQQVLIASGKAGIEKFAYRVDDQFHRFDVPLAAPIARTPDDNEFPPLLIRLRSKEDGSLSSIHLGNEVLGAEMNALQAKIIRLIGPEREPGSLQESIKLQITADDNLRLQHLADAYRTVSAYETPRGERVELVKNITPTALGQEEFDELEEFNVEKIEPVDVEVSEVKAPKEPRRQIKLDVAPEPVEISPVAKSRLVLEEARIEVALAKVQKAKVERDVAQARVTQIQAMIIQADITIRFHTAKHARIKKLSDENAVDQTTVDEVKYELDKATAALKELKAMLYGAKADAKSAEVDIVIAEANLKVAVAQKDVMKAKFESDQSPALLEALLRRIEALEKRLEQRLDDTRSE